MSQLLKDILYNVNLKTVSGDMNTAISSVSFDSRESKADSLFVAVFGTQVDGHDFINKALDKGAVAIVCEKLPNKLRPDVTYIETSNSSSALGHIAANFYDNPSKKLKLVAITGTNGKTTVATLLYNLFRNLGCV